MRKFAYQLGRAVGEMQKRGFMPIPMPMPMPMHMPMPMPMPSGPVMPNMKETEKALALVKAQNPGADPETLLELANKEIMKSRIAQLKRSPTLLALLRESAQSDAVPGSDQLRDFMTEHGIE